MNNIYLSKSRYCKCVQCSKILWLKEYKADASVPSEKDEVFEKWYILNLKTKCKSINFKF